MKKIFSFLLAFILLIVFLNIPVTTRQGINGEVRTLRIPFYIKFFEFLDRNYWYKSISHGITKERVTDEEKVMAIFDWCVRNIHNVPEGFDVVDDHVLNIIIRQCGTSDQRSDVFTTLCIYSGIPAFWKFTRPPSDKRIIITLSYVLVDGKWRVFDVGRNRFFLNDRGRLASVEDIISDISIVKKENIRIRGIPYEEFFSGLKPIDKDFISKEQQQVPLFRIAYEARHLFRRLKKKLYGHKKNL